MKKLILGVLMGLMLSMPAFAGDTVNVNTADAQTLATMLDGVGESRAADIVAYRESHGPFKSLDDLKSVKGVGDAIIEKNKDKIRFADDE